MPGLLCIAAAVLLLNSGQPYPGPLTLVPVAAALLLIAAGNDAAINRRLMSNRLLVGCGLISYPLYLWHWPLLSFGWIIGGHRPAPEIRVLLILLSVALAVLTYRFVERPLRFGTRLGLKSYALLAAMVVMGCAGFAASSGSIRSFSEDHGIDRKVSGLLAASNDWDYPGRGWEPVPVHQWTFFRYRGTRDQHVIWFFGDSEAEQYGPRIRALIAAHPEQYSSAVFTTEGGCPPLPNLVRRGAMHKCDGFFEQAFAYGKGSDVSTAVIGAAWPYIFDGEHYRYTKRRRGETAAGIREKIYGELETELGDLHARGKTVYLLLPIPMSVAVDPVRMISRRLALHPFGIEFRIAKPPGIPADTDPEVHAVRVRLAEIALKCGARVIDPYDSLCPHGVCAAFDEHGAPIYKDESHLRAAFVRSQASFIDRVLDGR